MAVAAGLAGPARGYVRAMGPRVLAVRRPATTVDHVVAVVLGGTHDLSNLRPCCQHCNSSTGASVGNRLRPRRPGRPLTGAQRRAIAMKRAEAGMPARALRSSRDW
jgi:hypothetical protein